MESGISFDRAAQFPQSFLVASCGWHEVRLYPRDMLFIVHRYRCLLFPASLRTSSTPVYHLQHPGGLLLLSCMTTVWPRNIVDAIHSPCLPGRVA